jgi:hypothetical protein
MELPKTGFASPRQLTDSAASMRQSRYADGFEAIKVSGVRTSLSASESSESLCPAGKSAEFANVGGRHMLCCASRMHTQRVSDGFERNSADEYLMHVGRSES